MATHVGSANGLDDATGTVLNTSSTIAVQSGDVIFAFSKWEGLTSGTNVVTDNASGGSNMYTSRANIDHGTGQVHAILYTAIAKASETLTFTQTLSITKLYRRILVLVGRPAGGTGFSFDNVGSATGIGSAASTGAYAVAGVGGYATSFVSDYATGSWTPGASWTEAIDNQSFGAYRLLTSETSITGDATWTASDSWIAMSAAFKEISTGSDTPLAVTKADIQPSGQSVAFANSMALTPASFNIGGSVVALQWQQDGWVISVDAAAITIAPQLLDGRRGIPVGTAIPTILGSSIQFQLSSGIWSVNVDTGIPTILGQSVNLEKNQFFSTGALTFSPSTIVLSENAVVVSAAPSIAGQDITLTWGQGSAGVISAAFSIQGQAIALERTWSLVVDPATLSFTGQSVLFDWVVPATVVVGSAQFSAVGSSFRLGLGIPITSTAISPIGQSIGRDDGMQFFPALFGISGQQIDLSFPFTLGLFLEKANPYFTGSDVVMFLGDGQPRVSKHAFFSDHIQLQQKPQIVTDKHKQVGSASH